MRWLIMTEDRNWMWLIARLRSDLLNIAGVSGDRKVECVMMSLNNDWLRDPCILTILLGSNYQ